jgi:uncharacterized protein YndB with AHSA1/START domain
MDSQTVRALIGTADHPELVLRRNYRATPDELRDACTSAERLGRWFGTIDGAPAAVGHEFGVDLRDGMGQARGRVRSCDDSSVVVSWSRPGEPDSILSAWWTALDVEVSELTLRHTVARPERYAEEGSGWEVLLQGLARALGTGATDATLASDAGADADAVWADIARGPLEVRQRVAAPVERVWLAFATAEGLRTWWWRHWSDVTIEAEVALGGAYRIEAPAAGIVLDGTFLAVEPPGRLAFSWRWSDDEGVSADEAVEVRLEPDGDTTLVTVRHSGPWADDAPAASYRQGWEYTLGELATVLEGAPRTRRAQ